MAPAAERAPAAPALGPSRTRAVPSLLRAGSVMAAGTALSRVLGFARAAVLASVVVGSLGPVADAFALANTVPNNIYLLVAGGVLNAVLVPQVVRASARPDGGADYLDRLVTTAVLGLAAVAALVTLAAPLVVSLSANEAEGDQRALILAFAYWCLPQVFFYGLYTLLGQVLNARGSFGPYTWAPVVNNVVGLAGLAVFVAVVGDRSSGAVPPGAWTPGEVALLAGSATLGVAAQALVLLLALRRAGIRLRPRLGVRGMGLASAGRVAGWTFAALVVGQVGWFTMSNVAVAATRAAGDEPVPGLATWGLAYLVFMLPHSLVAVSVVTALFTAMSAAAAAGDRAGVRRSLSTGLRTVGVASVLATTGVLVLATPVGVLITGRGPEGVAVGRVLTALVLGLTAFSAQYLLQRTFYAEEDARTPFLLQCLSVGLWVAGTAGSLLLLEPRDVLVGSAASLSAGTTASALVALVLLRRRLGGVDGRRVLRTHVRLALAGLVAGGAGLGVVRLLGAEVAGPADALLLLAAGGTAVVVAYVLVLRLLRVEEVAPLLARVPGLRRRVRR